MEPLLIMPKDRKKIKNLGFSRYISYIFYRVSLPTRFMIGCKWNTSLANCVYLHELTNTQTVLINTVLSVFVGGVYDIW